MHRMALDVHAEDLPGLVLCLARAVGQLHAASLAAAAGLHLGLDHYQRLGSRVGRLELCGDLLSFVCADSDPALGNRDTVLGEQLLRLVLEQVHWGPSFMLGG